MKHLISFWLLSFFVLLSTSWRSDSFSITTTTTSSLRTKQSGLPSQKQHQRTNTRQYLLSFETTSCGTTSRRWVHQPACLSSSSSPPSTSMSPTMIRHGGLQLFSHLGSDDSPTNRCSDSPQNQSPPRDDDSRIASRPRHRRRRGVALKRWVRRVAATALGYWMWRNPYTSPVTAHAKFAYELRENPTVSIRPGMNAQQAEQVLETGQLPAAGATAASDSDGIASSDSSSSSSTRAPIKAGKKSVKKSKSVYGDYLDDDEDDPNYMTEDDVVATPASFTSSSPSASTSGIGSQADQAKARKLAAQTRTHFASYHKGKSTALTTKVAVSLFAPTFGGMFVREFLRRRREEEYVKKGLEILEAQKAEYFNVTNVASDSDVQDALKGLKNPKKNETKSSDDDDDEDDDDDDDDDDYDDKPQYKLRRTPRPSGPKDGGGAGGGAGAGGSRGGGSRGGDDDLGYGKPSDEDLDKLKRLMGRS